MFEYPGKIRRLVFISQDNIQERTNKNIVAARQK